MGRRLGRRNSISPSSQSRFVVRNPSMRVFKVISFIFCLMPFTILGQTNVDYEIQNKFISSLRFCNIYEIQDTVCKRLIRQNLNLKSSNLNPMYCADAIFIGDQQKSCDYGIDTSVGNLCKIVKLNRPGSVLYKASARPRHAEFGWGTVYKAFNEDTLLDDGIKIFRSNDKLVVQIFSGFDFEIYEINGATREVINIFYSKDFASD
ncbi:MAG: hypothetical protein QM737_18575 [Ferruginibacter sp.]